VEVERARLTKSLAMLKEAEGKIAEASEILQEIAVETFGSMERKEKAEFLLEQMRLTLKQRDFVKMGILSGKIAKKQLGEVGFEEIRLRYYSLMIDLHQYRHDSLALSKDYEAISQTRGYAEDASKWIPALQSMIVYLSMSLWSNEVSDMLNHLKRDPRLADTDSRHHSAMAPYKFLVDALTTDEVISWPLSNGDFHATIVAHEAFTKATPGPVVASAGSSSASAGGMELDSGSSSAASSSTIVRKEDEARSPWLPILRKRLTQHNVRVISKCYGRVTVTRMAQLLGLDGDTTEAVVAELASDKALYAKIDRPAGEFPSIDPLWSIVMLTVLDDLRSCCFAQSSFCRHHRLSKA
jgi:26S proteasome regulatory subunit N5